MGEIQNLRKQIDFNNLTYYFKVESGPRNFISFNGQLAFHKNMKDGKSRRKTKENIKSDIN